MLRAADRGNLVGAFPKVCERLANSVDKSLTRQGQPYTIWTPHKQRCADLIFNISNTAANR